ncbi:reverse transcriptase-like protein [Elysia marginata]|uniref:Reverse transcriptase-like protein n=1 Tax=Elysia marginata TaxID=1093978 RepID=A0AAV4GJQ9_9GAST|nr:reverse transcriptase-like protein [Elysia marginata]
MDMEAFKRSILEAEDSKKVEACASVDEKINVLSNTISNVLEAHSPQKVKSIVIRPNCKWYTDGLRKAKQERRKAERRWEKSRLEIDRQLYVTIKNKVNDMIKSSKRKYFKDKLFEAKGNCKELHKLMTSLLKPKCLAQNQLPTHETTGNMCENFNKFFTEKIIKIREELNDDIEREMKVTATGHRPGSIMTEFTPASIEEIEKVLKEMPNKTCALDTIPAWIYKQCFKELAPSMRDIVNTSLSTGDFPDSLKLAYVTPIIKKTLP